MNIFVRLLVRSVASLLVRLFVSPSIFFVHGKSDFYTHKLTIFLSCPATNKTSIQYHSLLKSERLRIFWQEKHICVYLSRKATPAMYSLIGQKIHALVERVFIYSAVIPLPQPRQVKGITACGVERGACIIIGRQFGI